MPAKPEQELQRLKEALKLANTAVYEWNPETRQFQWTHPLPDSLGLPKDDCGDKESLCQYVPEEDGNIIESQQTTLKSREKQYDSHFRLKAPDGTLWQVHDTGKQLNGSPAVLGVMTFERASEEFPVNGNRAAQAENLISPIILPSLNKAIEESLQSKESGALLIISVDNLAMIIEAHGHEIATRIMHRLCEEIQSLLPEHSSLTQMHMDHFVVVLPQATQEETAQLCLRINEALRSFGRHSDLKPLHILSSIGSVNFPDSVTTATEAIDRAYIALHSPNNLSYQAFEASAGEENKSRNQMELANFLQQAIEERKLRLAYQPIIETSTGKTAHYECLLRLVNDDGKVSSAGALIPVAERMGMIDVIDKLVLKLVAKELLHSEDVTLAFNVSNLTTGDEEWLQTFSDILDEHPEIAPRMIVEVTETAAHRDIRETAYFIASIQAKGAKVALDDFGSGYTSFRQLKSLSVDVVKIDGSFIRDVAYNSDNQFFVKTLLDFVNGFGLEAVAECVETGDAAKFLMDAGVHYMQGYYFGRSLLHRPWINGGEYEAD